MIGFKTYKYYHYNGELIGIRGTGAYHRDYCKFVKKSTATNYIFFRDLKNTADSEFRPCKTCKPPTNKKEVALYTKKILAEKEKQKEQEQTQKTSSAVNSSNSKSDISKVVIAGHSVDKNDYNYTIKGTVKNNDKFKHKVCIQVIYYNSKNQPFYTRDSDVIYVDPDELESFEIDFYGTDNIVNIVRHELKVKEYIGFRILN